MPVFSYPLVMIGLISTNTSHNNLCLLGDPQDVNDYANNSGSPAGGGRGEEHQPALGVGRICHKHVTGLILRVG